MKKLFFILCAMLMITTLNARVHEELKGQAEEYAALLEKDNWMIVPTKAIFPKTITFLDMRDDINYFRVVDNKMNISLNFMGTRVSHALSEEQLFRLAEENADLLHLLETAPPFFKAECNIIKKTVQISKTYKTVTMEISCNASDKNFNDFNSVPSFTVRIDVKSGIAEIVCRGMRYDETFEGSIYKVEVSE